MDTDKEGGKRWKKTKKELIVYSAHLAGKSKGALASQGQKVGVGELPQPFCPKTGG